MFGERTPFVYVIGYVILRKNARKHGTVGVYVGEHNRYAEVALAVEHEFFYTRRDKFQLFGDIARFEHVHVFGAEALLVKALWVEQLCSYALGLGHEVRFYGNRATPAQPERKAFELRGSFVGVDIGRAAHEYAAGIFGSAHTRLYALRYRARERLKAQKDHVGSDYFIALFYHVGQQTKIYVPVQPAAF